MFAPQEGAHRTRRTIRWTCMTPMKHCSGAIDKQDGNKSHASPHEVRKCYVRYLVSVGYKRTGTRTLENPDTGRVLVLPKRPEMGADQTGEQGAVEGEGESVA